MWFGYSTAGLYIAQCYRLLSLSGSGVFDQLEFAIQRLTPQQVFTLHSATGCYLCLVLGLVESIKYIVCTASITHAILNHANIAWVKTATYYMGKMGIVYMGNIDGSENNSRSVWTEQKRFHNYANAGGGKDTRQQGEISGHQPQRTNRAYGSNRIDVSVGETPIGGTVSQLISDYRDQVASKLALIQQTQEEIDYLQSRIKQFEELTDSLNQSSE